MARVGRIAGWLLLGLVVVLGVAPSLGGVGQLRTLDENDVRQPTQLWYVEGEAGRVVVRGEAGAAWVERLRREPRCDFIVPGAREHFRGTIHEDPKLIAAWNRQFREKYGFRDRMLALRRTLLFRGPWVAVELTPSLPIPLREGRRR